MPAVPSKSVETKSRTAASLRVGGRAYDRPMATDLASSLRRVPLFAELGNRDINALTRMMKERSFPEGTAMTREGESGIGFFVILDGTATVSVHGTKRRELGAGDFFGEIALIDERGRTASITADTEVRCVGITSWEFRPFVREHPDVAWGLLTGLASHLRDAERVDA
jgi:CRP-like cAMP-binding protein